MPFRTADLHFHSLHSDGKHTVAEVAAYLKTAFESDLSLAVLTDHDGIAGFGEFASELSEWTPLICASELSCGFIDPETGKDRELHLLVYGFDPSDSYINEKFSAFRVARHQRFLKIAENLKSAGYEIDGPSLAAKHGGVLGRPHIADAMIEKGYATSRQDAFSRFLKDGSPYVAKKWRLPLDEILQTACQRGWRTSIAHPGQYGFRAPQLRYFKDLGAHALEIYHPSHTRDLYLYYLDQAKYFGFGITGGSDFHTYETDQRSGVPTLGRVRYPWDQAQQFLKGIL